MLDFLQEAPDAGTPRRMGRPALGVRATKIRLSDDVRKRIEALVGDRGMAEFVRQAVEAHLERVEAAAGTRHEPSDD